jgi:ATP-dependent Zn protease
VNRFFRSAFFPLLVIVLLVWLASQTLIPKSSSGHKLTTSEAIQRVKTNQVASAVFNPSKRSIALKLADGSKATVHYASDQAQLQFQNDLTQAGVEWTRRGRAASRGRP